MYAYDKVVSVGYDPLCPSYMCASGSGAYVSMLEWHMKSLKGLKNAFDCSVLRKGARICAFVHEW